MEKINKSTESNAMIKTIVKIFLDKWEENLKKNAVKAWTDPKTKESVESAYTLFKTYRPFVELFSIKLIEKFLNRSRINRLTREEIDDIVDDIKYLEDKLGVMTEDASNLYMRMLGK